MRKTLFGAFVMFVALLIAAPVAFAENVKMEKVRAKDLVGEFINPPDGYIAVISPSGRDYVLMSWSPEDYTLAADGRTLQALTDQGRLVRDVTQHAADTKKTAMEVGDALFMEDLAADGVFAEGVIAPVVDVSCDGDWECGRLLRGTNGGLHCIPVTGCSCTLWREICTLN